MSWIVVIPIRRLIVSDASYIEFDHAPQWEVATVRRVAALSWCKSGCGAVEQFGCFQIPHSSARHQQFHLHVSGASLKGVMIQSKNLSFVWAGLSKFCVLNARHTIISGTRIRSVCTLVDGELPDTCVSGSGVYRCISVVDNDKHVFELRLTYFEVEKLGNSIYVNAIIDVAGSKPHLPLGLFTAQT